ncbi:MAG TPA: MlaD family protein [Steroidobacteraceae bacterium]|nr:MlaD family protein [Steroidobacteraceae bacterium]
MEREASYLTVGAFVLLVLALGTWFVIWYTDTQDQRDYKRFEIYFEGSVAGLSKGGPVRYLGVDVGRVVRMDIDPRAADRVEVVVDIDAQAPITDETLATLSLQGVTGLLYIDLERDRGDKPVMPRVASQRYPVIRTVKSNFDILLSGLPDLFGQGANLAQRMSKLFNDENVAAVGATLDNLNRASSELPGILKDVHALVGDTKRTLGEIEGAANGLRDITEGSGPDIKAALERARVTMDHLASTSERLDQFVNDNQANITRFSDQGLLELQQLIRESREAAEDFRDLSRSIKRQPSQLLYEQKYSGVEIPR